MSPNRTTQLRVRSARPSWRHGQRELKAAVDTAPKALSASHPWEPDAWVLGDKSQGSILTSFLIATLRHSREMRLATMFQCCHFPKRVS